MNAGAACFVLLQGRTGPHFDDLNAELIDTLLARYPNLVSRSCNHHHHHLSGVYVCTQLVAPLAQLPSCVQSAGIACLV